MVGVVERAASMAGALKADTRNRTFPTAEMSQNQPSASYVSNVRKGSRLCKNSVL